MIGRTVAQALANHGRGPSEMEFLWQDFFEVLQVPPFLGRVL